MPVFFIQKIIDFFKKNNLWLKAIIFALLSIPLFKTMILDERPYRFLIIEDNAADYLLIKTYLSEKISKKNYTRAKNFAAAKKLLNVPQPPYDLILLDITLPDLSGEMLVNEMLRLTNNNCPIIILSALSDSEFSILSISKGISDFLVKDELNASVLYKSIIYAVERRKNMVQLEESEKKYSSLFYSSPQPMWVYDLATLNFLQVNQAAVNHYGYSEADFLSMTILDIRPENEKAGLLKGVAQRFQGKTEVYSGSYRHKKKSGEIITVEIYSTPVTINGKLCRSIIAIDVTERNAFEHKLLKAIIKTQEEERYEIGGELHDNVCQILAASIMGLSMIQKNIPADSKLWYDAAKQNITLATQEIRSLSHRLAPAFFDDSSLEEAIGNLLKTFNIFNKYQVTFKFNPRLNTLIHQADLQLNLYRILQEQLRNIMKYAQATTIVLSLNIEGENILLRLCDNGAGFDVHAIKSGIGIANMKRRTELFGGDFELISSPGKGCTITVTIPLEQKQ